jgi:hypothetical protein
MFFALHNEREKGNLIQKLDLIPRVDLSSGKILSLIL